jgi:Asp-tRNA(Asn)/Glu-tRNA(Gln) amidotransferase A subunit family amidase
MAVDINSSGHPQMRSFFSVLEDIRAGNDSPSAFLERCIVAIEQHEEQVGAFVVTGLEAARSEAQRSSARWADGRPLSAIDGMPIGVKDIMETAGMATEQGSPLFKDWAGGRDCAAVAALREAGAIILGKTVTTEFASRQARGTRNPWDLNRTPGGSSSGSGAAVACGMIPGALGSQVVGSTIRPASYCGAYGYKPSVGGINRGGSFDGFSQSCTGVIAASLAECWVIAREISARAGGDPGYVGVLGPRELPPSVLPRRLAMLLTGGWDKASEEAKVALAAVREKFVLAGIEVLDATTDARVGRVETAIVDAAAVSSGLVSWEGRWPLNTYKRDMDAAGLSESAVKRLARAETMTQEDYQALLIQRDDARATYALLRTGVDACVTLAAPGAAPQGLDWTGDPSFTVPTSLVGMPSVSLPVLQEQGLPLGLQVIGFTNEDAALFAVAGGLLALC